MSIPGRASAAPTGSNLALSVTIKALTLREKWETSEGNVSFRSVVDTCWSWRMVDEVLRKAVDTAWTVYLATHRDVDVADDAYWSAICKGGWRPAKARLKN